jgi:hypothetical protein
MGLIVGKYPYILVLNFLFLSLTFVSPALAVTRAIYILGTRHGISDSYELQLHQEVAEYIKQLCLEVVTRIYHGILLRRNGICMQPGEEAATKRWCGPLVMGIMTPHRFTDLFP